jgi:hypothetical protein
VIVKGQGGKFTVRETRCVTAAHSTFAVGKGDEWASEFAKEQEALKMEEAFSESKVDSDEMARTRETTSAMVNELASSNSAKMKARCFFLV